MGYWKRIVLDLLILVALAGVFVIGKHLYRDHQNLHTLVQIEYTRQQAK